MHLMIILQLLLLTGNNTPIAVVLLECLCVIFISSQPVCAGQQPAIRPELLEQSEYSYFSQAAVEAWAGPQHWKLRPRSNDQGMLNNLL